MTHLVEDKDHGVNLLVVRKMVSVFSKGVDECVLVHGLAFVCGHTHSAAPNHRRPDVFQEGVDDFDDRWACRDETSSNERTCKLYIVQYFI